MFINLYAIHQTQLKHEKQIKHLFAQTYFLFAKTLNYHWNIKSKSFLELHRLFEEQYEELLKATDLIAEHMRSQNLYVEQTLPMTSKELGTINPKLSDEQMIKDLCEDHEKIAAYLNKVAPLIEDINTNDLMIERCRAHEKAAWMLRSYISLSS